MSCASTRCVIFDYLVRMVPVVRPSGDIPYINEVSMDITAVKVMAAAEMLLK